MSGPWQRQVLASSGYLELGLPDDAERALQEIDANDEGRNEVLGARVALYVATGKWSLAASIARHLVKVEPQNAVWWINLAYSVRRCESIEEAEAILLRAEEIHPGNALIVFNLACYASVCARLEEAKVRLRRAMNLDRVIRHLAIGDEDLRPLWGWLNEPN
jgi:Flp pilus assembly protein TadD